MKSEATPGREELPHSTIRLLALAEKLEGPQCLVSADDRAIAATACRLAAKPADEGVREATIEQVSKRLVQMADNMSGMHAPELKRLARALSTTTEPKR